MFCSAALFLAVVLCSAPGQSDAGSRSAPPPKTPGSAGEQLHAAVRAGDLAEVRKLVAAGTDVDARDDMGSTPLLDAAWGGSDDIAAFLIAHGADVNAHHLEAGSTALQYAVMTSHVALIKTLLAAGARVDVNYRDGQSVLHAAASRGHPPVIDLLLSARADVNALDANSNTPLDDAVLHGQTEAVTLLLQHGAQARRVHPADGRGPLHEACMKGFANLVQPLVAAGADPAGRDRFGQTPLDIALAYKNGNVVAALLKLGLKLKESGGAAQEAMETAALRGQTEVARLLIDNGFDVNSPAPNGSTYLNDAALKGQKRMVELLLDRGARIGARNQEGGTPLHDAALGGDADVIALLLDRGAAIDAAEEQSGATPLMLAASLGRLEAVAHLLKRGANPLLRDNAGHTALDRARETEDGAIIKLLEDAPRGKGAAAH